VMLPVAILAGGFATRLDQLAMTTPKSLIEVHGRPFIEWQLELLVKNGYTNFVFCLSHLSDQIQGYLGDGSRYGVKFQYSFDGEKQLGTGGALRKALPMLGNEFALIYGDSYLPIEFINVEKKFRAAEKKAMMTVYRNRNHFDQSNVDFYGESVLKYSKSEISGSMEYIDYGLTYLHKTVFDSFSEYETFDLSFVFSKLASDGEMGGFQVFERFYEIGTHEGIAELFDYLREGNHDVQ
jgi:MurNAc alpha-1-phosphate uridylyltransferase